MLSRRISKKPLQQDIYWVMKYITGSTLVLSEFLFQKQVNMRNIELGVHTKNLELSLCTSSSEQMCTFCNCYQFWAARAEFLFTESICAIKFYVCYDLYINTHNNTKITLHKYHFFGCGTALPLFAYALCLLCLQSLKNFLAVSSIPGLPEMDVVSKMGLF